MSLALTALMANIHVNVAMLLITAVLITVVLITVVLYSSLCMTLPFGPRKLSRLESMNSLRWEFTRLESHDDLRGVEEYYMRHWELCAPHQHSQLTRIMAETHEASQMFGEESYRLRTMVGRHTLCFASHYNRNQYELIWVMLLVFAINEHRARFLVLGSDS